MSNETLSAIEIMKRELLLRRLNKSGKAPTRLAAQSAIPKADRSQPMPLSWAQQRLWFLDQLDHAAGAAYNLSVGLRLSGTLNRLGLQGALDRIIARHEVLRTRFDAIDGQAIQVVAPEDTGFSLLEHDLSKLSAREQQVVVSRLSAAEEHLTFDLTTGPLIRAQLLCLAQDEHILLITQHHIVTDGWSNGVLVQELVSLYAAISAGAPDPLPPLAIQYGDYAAWQRAWLHGDILQAQLDFWRGHLQGAPALLELPLDRNRPPKQSYVGGIVPIKLSLELTKGLRQLGQRHGGTLFMVLLAGWAIVLARLSGQYDVVIGAPIANRQRRELEVLVGFFVNTLGLRVSMDDNPSVAALLAQVKTNTLNAYAHQDLPFEQVVEMLKPVRSMSHAPIFQVSLALNNMPEAGTIVTPGLTLSQLEQPHTTTHFDLSLSFLETDHGISGDLEYASDLFDASTIARWTGHLETVLAAMVADDQQQVKSLPLLKPIERQQLLVDFNATARNCPQERLVHQLIEAQASANPDAIALVYQDQQMSYDALNRRANQLAHHLIGLGVGPDHLVAICVERSFDMVIGLLAILKAGAAYVPLDPSFPAERLAFMLDDTGSNLIITQMRYVESVPVDGRHLLCMDRDAALIARQADDNPPNRVQAHHLAYCMYTSGSTGQPKGVAIPHRSVLGFMLNVDYVAYTPASVMLHFASSSWDVLTLEVWPMLVHGGRVVLYAGSNPTPHDIGQCVNDYGVNLLWLTSAFFNALVDDDVTLLGNVEQLMVGGEKVSSLHVAKLMRHQPAIRVVNGYGPSECTVFSTCYVIPHTLTDREQNIPIGKPIGDRRIYLLDQSRNPVPIGVVGELYVAGDSLARGYINLPEQTAERFIADPFADPFVAPDGRMYHTGDLARWLPDGNIDFVGRIDHQVKLRGFRIELGEITARLSECDGVMEAAVIVREDTPGDKRLAAYVVAHDGVQLSATTLREQLASILPVYMVPSAFVILDVLPLTPNGKLDRKALPMPDQDALATREYAAPVGDLEIAIAQIWQDLLGLEQVGRQDQFFELGGHSLLAVQLVSRLRQKLGIELALRDLFAEPSLAGLARLAASADRANLSRIKRVDRSGPIPLSWAQQRLWFLDQLDHAAGAAYHIAMALRLQGELNLPALQATLDRIIARHEVLRTTFVAVDGQAMQAIASDETRFALLERDLSDLPELQQHAEVQQLCQAEERQAFSLADGPLIRGQLLRLAEDQHILLITQHHIITDGWSIGVLVQEVAALYTAFCQAQPDPLPPLGIQYADYAAWQREWLRGAALQVQSDFWLRHLQGAPALLELPTDHPRPPAQSYKGKALPVLLPAQLVGGLRQLGRRHGSTLFMTLLTGWAIVLSRLSGQDDVVIGTPIANRQHGEIESLMGFFVNTLVMRVRLEDNPSVASLLAQVKTDTLDAYAHQDLPFEQVVEVLKPVRSLSHAPVFQVSLTLNNMPNTGALNLPGLSLSQMESHEHSTKVDMSLVLIEAGDVVEGTLTYASDLFDETTINRWIGHLHIVLNGMVHDDQQHIAQLPLLSEGQRQQLLFGFNATARDYPHDQVIHRCFEAQVLANPAATALVYEGRAMTYDELNRRANQLAHHLIGLGIAPDDRIAICIERSPEMIIGMLGILKAGGAYVPLDVAYPAERLAWMLDDCAPSALVSQSAQLDNLPWLACPVVALDEQAALLARQPGHNLVGSQLTSRHMAYVIYTSGSTGLPKGVMVEHRSVLRLVINNPYALIGADDCIAHCANPAFDASTWEIWGALLNGARLLLVPQAVMLEPINFSNVLIEEGVTALWMTVGLFNEYVGLLENAFSHLRYLLVGGDALDPRSIARLLSSGHRPQHVVNGYGPTETTTFAATFEIRTLAADARTVPIGRPIANTQIYILDAHGQPTPLGVAGEIHIGGAGVARGYLFRPDLTEERFVDDIFGGEPGGRLYKTGDLGRWLADGNIAYIGRNDFQVKIRGFRIELGEIEARLAECAGVREAVVLAREEEFGEKRLVAYLLAHDGVDLVAISLREQLAAMLPGYMVPSAFVIMEVFPLTPNGKLDRHAFPAPEHDAAATREYAEPVGDTEIEIAKIWRELLGLDRIGRNDQFFELGGHSLLAVQLVSRVRQVLGIELELRELFAQPTLAGLATLAGSAKRANLSRIERADRSLPLPLSWAQQRLWFIDRLDHAAGAAYHIPAGLLLAGDLNRDALQATLDRIIARHEVLRTTFTELDGQVHQIIGPVDTRFRLHEQDISQLPQLEQQAAVRHLSEAEAQQPFDLAGGPLVRGQLLRLAKDQHILLITQHHIVTDGWSVGVLVQEVVALYGAFCQGLADPLPPLTIQYADFSVWQRQWLQGAQLEEQLDFWRASLQGAPALLELPLDHMRPSGQSYAGGMLPVTFPAELCHGLRQLSQRHGATLFMTLLTGWAIVLARLSGQNDVVIGAPIANRQRGELEGLIGFFVNTLALRVRLEDNPSVAALLAQVRTDTLNVYAHQDLPFEQVVEAVKPVRSMSHAPVFQVMLALNNTPTGGALLMPGLTLSPLASSHVTSHFDMSLSFSETDAGLEGALEYASDLFDASTIVRWIGYLQTTLAGMVEDDQQHVSQLSLLSEEQRHHILHDFNATAKNTPQQQLIHQLFESQAAANPGATALVYGEQQISYDDVNRSANRLAHRLLALGIGPDDRVAICAERGPQMVIGLLGILKAGGAYVPLDPTYPAERLAHMLSDSAPVALLTEEALRDVLPAVEVPVLLLGQDALHVNDGNPDPKAQGLAASNLAYVIYTSGSTGLPKGVMNHHRGLCNLALAQQQLFGVGPGSRVLQFASFSFDASIWECVMALCSGASLHLAPQADLHPGEPLWQTLQQHQITHATLPGAVVALWGDAHLPQPITLIVAGDACPPAVARHWSVRHRMFNAYGPTETTVCASVFRCTPQLTGSVPIGRPITNAQMYILDQHGQLAPIGVAGEIHVGGAGVARGYLNQAGLTAERFIDDSFSDVAGARLYKTGDLGRWLPDGDIEYLGRNDFQVKMRGFRVELGEIEARLAACDGIGDVAVIAREDQPGDKRLVAYFVPRETAVIAVADLREQLAAQLPSHMVPSAFVGLAALPLTPNGKLDRKALPAPDQDAVATHAWEEPAGEIENAIAQIWQSLLGLERVGRQDQFFELGGHSLLAVQLLSRMRQALGVDLALRDLFAEPSLIGLARLAGSAERVKLTRITRADRSGPLPLSWAQQRLWFLDQLDHAAGAAYHLPAGLRLVGNLDRAALQATFDRIIARHEVLRTNFVLLDGQARQMIASADTAFCLREQDLSSMQGSAQQAAVARLAGEEAVQAFDLANGPLFRGQLLRLSEDEHILLITHHHIITDGWSIGVMVQEVVALYTAFCQGAVDPLPPLAIQYADYATWQRNWLQGEVLQQQLEFWRDHLQGAPALLELPLDHPRPAAQSYAGDLVQVRFSEELTSGLRQLGQRHGCTLFMSLLAGWAIVLARLSGQDDMVIGAPIANRQRDEVEGLIGFFVNTLALRVQLQDNPSVAALLATIKANTLDAYAHQDLPFEQVVEVLNPVRSMSHPPVFQVSLTLNNMPNNGEQGLPGLRLSQVESKHHTAKVDLSLLLAESDKRIEGTLVYASGLFEADTITRWVGYLHTVLEGMVANDLEHVNTLPLMSAAERTQLLVAFNDSTRDVVSNQMIHQLFESQVVANPDAIALVYEDQQLSYAQLNRRANQLAHHLITLGIGPDERVAICVERSPELVIGMLGILKAGGAYVPLDPNYPLDRLAYMLEDCAPSVLVSQAAQLDNLPWLAAPVVVLDEQAAQLARQPEHNPVVVGLTPDHLAYVIYTSGSTGLPKGVMNHHRGLCNLAVAQKELFGAGPDSRVLQFASFSFDASIWECVMALTSGASLHLASLEALRPGEPLLHTLQHHQITHATLPGAVVAMWEGQFLHNSITLIVAGDAFPPAVAQQWSARHRLFNAYGPTETTVCASAYRCMPVFGGSVPIGRPIANTQIYILDRNGQPVPLGVAGEIHIGGACVARGYLFRPELTEERFIANPFSHDAVAKLYKTGDLGRWLPDGNIEYLGRNDFQVKIRGFRIELGEIEARLTECIGIREAVVIAREDQPGDKRLVAYLLTDEGVDLSVAALREKLGTALPAYMVPSAFVMLTAFPLSANGKLDRRALPTPDQGAVVTQEYEAPMGDVEVVVAQIWQELLGLERIGRHDHFFELGGHSLMVVTLIERLRQNDLVMDVRDVFTAPTLSEMALIISNRDGAASVCVVPPNLILLDSRAITPAMLPLANMTQAEIDTVIAKVPGGLANVQDIYALAPLQEGILFHHMINTGRDAYLSCSVVEFDSRSRLDSFLSALQVVMDRHDILRTAFCWEGLSQPAQVVYRKAQLPIAELVLVPDQGLDPVTQLLGQVEAKHGVMDLRRAPLLAAYVAANPDSDGWLLGLHEHHIISDNFTLQLVLAEIQCMLSGEGEHLPVPVPYRNFIAQTQTVAPEVHEAYFRQQLGDVVEPTAPFGLLDVQANGDPSEEERVILDGALAQSIRDTARHHGVTAAVLFHVAFAQVLLQCSGRDDVVFGTVLSGRLQGSEGANQVLGMFINTLPIRLSLAGRSVKDVVTDTYQRLSELLSHEQASLALAQRCSGVSAPLPLFSALLNYRHPNIVAPANDEGALEIWEGMRLLSAKEQTNYPFDVSVDDFKQEFVLTAKCNRTIGPLRIIGFLQTAIERLIDALNTRPQRPIRELCVLPEAERQKVLVEFNPAAQHYPHDQMIHQLFEVRARAQGEALALHAKDAQMSYAELNRRANQLAHYLIGLGVKPNSLIGVCMQRSSGMVVALLAILKAGGAYVPLDPNYPEQRLAYIVEDSEIGWLLTQTQLLPQLKQYRALEAAQTVLLALNDEVLLQTVATQPQTDPVCRTDVGADGLAYLIYTSGSTGQPKAVQIRHRNAVAMISWAGTAFSTAELARVLCSTSLNFDLSVFEIFVPLSHGGTVVLVEDAMALLHAQSQASLRYALDVSMLNTVPSACRALVDQGAIPAGVKVVNLAGEALAAGLVNDLLALGSVDRVCNLYGPSEDTTYSSWADFDKPLTGTVTIGKPISNTRFYILDSHAQPVPIGVAGEIHIGGAGVALGYLKRPELTAERFIADPFNENQEARLYKTGDLGRWLADGNIEYLGRNDFQVKIRGFRIELGEIEARLTEYPGISEAAVIAREDQPGDQRLVAYFTVKPGVEIDAGALRGYLGDVMPSYMTPGAFVCMAAFPLNPNGKLDRKALPMPDQEAVAANAYAAPIGEMEIAIAHIWQELLGVQQVGRNDQFFELGGHSLLAIRLVSRLRQVIGIEVELRELFAQPTLAGLAAFAVGAKRSNLARILPVDRSQPLPLSWAQQRLWFLDQLDHAAGAAYHIPVGLRLQGQLNLEALQATFDRIIARHEILRTRFLSDDGQAIQVVDEEMHFNLREQDLSGLSAQEQQTAVQRLSESEVHQPFDLTSGPLIRGQLLHLAEEEHILLITQHHIITDGWSINVMVAEVAALYNAFSQGIADPLPPLPIQYADYAVWQREWLKDAALQAQLDFWVGHLQGAPTLLELPTDYPRPPVQSYAGGSVSLPLSMQLSQDLRNLSERHGTTMFMTLLTGWAIFLSRLCGQSEVVIGVPIANRQRSEVESLIGFFVNTLALRVSSEENPSVASLLLTVKADTLDAYAHQDLPFEQVVEALKPLRSMSHSPVFQTSLTLNNTPDVRTLSTPGLTLSALEQSRTSTHFDLSLVCNETDTNITVNLEYASDLFDASTIARWAGHLQCVLAAMVADDGQRVNALSMLSTHERQQLLVEFNATAQPFPQNQLMHQLFEAQAAANPTATALVHESRQLSYHELNRRANRLAHHLIGLGIRPDDRVAICVERSVEMVVGIMGILKAGAAYVPLDPGYPAERLAYMLTDCVPAVLLTQANHLQHLSAGDVPVVLLDMDHVAMKGDGNNWDANPAPFALALNDRHLAYVIYTSGSTGLPKGVMIEHANAANLLHTHIANCTLSSADRVLQFASFGFDSSIEEIFAPLAAGAVVVLRPAHIFAPDKVFLEFMQAQRITVAELPTAFWHQWVQESPPSAGQSLQHLRLVVVGGEKAEHRHLASWFAHESMRNCRWLNTYGPTEATVYATAIGFDGGSPLPAVAVPIGRPIANTQIYILDPHGQPVPQGVAGEMHIGGVGVARGYLFRPELTSERFIADPFSTDPQARLYKTGDLGRWLADGNIEYMGRNDFQVKIRGFRIELGEIEARLIACEGIREALVIACEDQSGDKRLVAYLVADQVRDISAATLREQLSAVLPAYMVPGAFVTLDAFPLNQNGKIDRKALPAPDQSAVATSEYEAPIGEVEIAIAEIWQELLGVERVGRHDQFFELGGHSLLAMRLIARLEQRLGIEVALRELFSQPSLCGLAAVLTPHAPAKLYPNLVPIRIGGSGRPVFLIHPYEGEIGYALALAPHIEQDVPIYGFAASGFLFGETALKTIEEMAALYIQGIRHVQPRGPYRLAGWSGGGTIAYEIANQLIGADESVEFLGLIDTVPGYGTLQKRSLTDKIMRREADEFDEIATVMTMLPANTSNADLTEFRRLAKLRDLDAMLILCQQIGLLPQELAKDALLRYFNVRYSMIVALHAYAIYPLSVPISLFMAIDGGVVDRLPEWEKLAIGGIQVSPLSGDHYSIMERRNIKKLGDGLSQAIARAVKGQLESPESPESSYTPRFTIQRGNANVQPLFCVPGAGASVTAFYALAQALDQSLPIYGLQPRGLCGRLAPHIDVPSTARAYIRSIREISPSGPYRLLGHSFGGWVVSEMARQLEADGEEVSVLVTLDTRAPSDGTSKKRHYSRLETLLRLVGLFDMNLKKPLHLTAADFAPLTHEQQLELLLERLVKAKVMPPKTNLQVMRGIVRVFSVNLNIDYQVQDQYRGTQHLVLVTNSAGTGNADRAAQLLDGWRKHVPHISHWDGPGNHMTLLAEPHVNALAKWLNRLLKGDN
jgi:amino acid adenylation domain-containing protein